jgi:hypothetical protein
MRAILATTASISFRPMVFLGLVDDVDRLIRQLTIGDVARRQVHRGLQRLGGVAQLVELLIVALQALEDLQGVLDRRLVDVDLLEPAHQGAVLFKVLAELLVGGRAHAAQRAGGQRRLQQVGGVHRPAAGRAGADDGVDLVDEQDSVGVVLQLLDHLLDPLFEVAAVAGAGQQRPHVQREHGRAGQHVGHVVIDDLAGQALGDGGLADAGVADQQRIVLGAPAKDLDAALDLAGAANERIDLPGAGLLIEVDAIGFQRLAAGLHRRLLVVIGALDGPALRGARLLGDAVGDEVDRVVAAHLLLLQEVGGVAFALGEDGDQHIGAGDVLLAGRLDVDHRALDNALEPCCRLGVLAVIDDDRGELGVEIVHEALLQRAHVDVAGVHHRRGVLVVDQGEQQVLGRGVFVLSIVGELNRPMKRIFEVARERGQGDSILFHGALKRMAFAPGGVDHLGDLGFGDVKGEDAADADSMLVHVKHDRDRVLA